MPRSRSVSRSRSPIRRRATSAVAASWSFAWRTAPRSPTTIARPLPPRRSATCTWTTKAKSWTASPRPRTWRSACPARLPACSPCWSATARCRDAPWWRRPSLWRRRASPCPRTSPDNSSASAKRSRRTRPAPPSSPRRTVPPSRRATCSANRNSRRPWNASPSTGGTASTRASPHRRSSPKCSVAADWWTTRTSKAIARYGGRRCAEPTAATTSSPCRRRPPAACCWCRC